ncbi:hypothetical protein KMZ68_10390 [Bradyrhizobium sediminis]|uniref:Uncharacterized protein n=1 Tax=Bradyrhizobium sediminis TaxID=2840469 RepID=A0A975NT22_9BRAD|nr:hypothetical protein [Bradyrhizobium sediminis]QWG20201.1 hypothetical protein KMZ68_10390 [Bradyrhizobium sediminis]
MSGEEFNRLRLDGGNKSTVNEPPDDGHVAIFAAASTRLPGAAIFLQRAVCGTVVPAGVEGIGEMRQVNSFLRSATSRIGRRFKLIVAIAAASLPSAGA